MTRKNNPKKNTSVLQKQNFLQAGYHSSQQIISGTGRLL